MKDAPLSTYLPWVMRVDVSELILGAPPTWKKEEKLRTWSLMPSNEALGINIPIINRDFSKLTNPEGFVKTI